MPLPQVSVPVTKTAQTLSTNGTEGTTHMQAHVLAERLAAAVLAGAYLTDETPIGGPSRKRAIRIHCTGRKDQLENYSTYVAYKARSAMIILHQ